MHWKVFTWKVQYVNTPSIIAAVLLSPYMDIIEFHHMLRSCMVETYFYQSQMSSFGLDMWFFFHQCHNTRDVCCVPLQLLKHLWRKKKLNLDLQQHSSLSEFIGEMLIFCNSEPHGGSDSSSSLAVHKASEGHVMSQTTALCNDWMCNMNGDQKRMASVRTVNSFYGLLLYKHPKWGKNIKSKQIFLLDKIVFSMEINQFLSIPVMICLLKFTCEMSELWLKAECAFCSAHVWPADGNLAQ